MCLHSLSVSLSLSVTRPLVLIFLVLLSLASALLACSRPCVCDLQMRWNGHRQVAFIVLVALCLVQPLQYVATAVSTACTDNYCDGIPGTRISTGSGSTTYCCPGTGNAYTGSGQCTSSSTVCNGLTPLPHSLPAFFLFQHRRG